MSCQMPQPRQRRSPLWLEQAATHAPYRGCRRATARQRRPSRRLQLDRLERPVRPSCDQRCASTDTCNPDCQRASTRASGAYRSPGGPVSRAVHAARARFGRPPRPPRPGVVARRRRRVPTSDAPSPPQPAPLVGTGMPWPRLPALRSRERPQRAQPGTPCTDRKLRRAFRRATLARGVGSRRRFALWARGPRARAATPNQPQPIRPRDPTTSPVDLCKHQGARAHLRTIGPRARGGLFSTTRSPCGRERRSTAADATAGTPKAPASPDGALSEQLALAAQRPAGQRARRPPVIDPSLPQTWMPRQRTDRPRPASDRPRERTSLPWVADATTERNRSRLRETGRRVAQGNPETTWPRRLRPTGPRALTDTETGRPWRP